jgi:hypothetical protein
MALRFGLSRSGIYRAGVYGSEQTVSPDRVYKKMKMAYLVSRDPVLKVALGLAILKRRRDFC